MSPSKLIAPIFYLNNKTSANALSLEAAKILQEQMTSALKQGVQGCVIASAHPRIFCSGGDLRAYSAAKTKSAGVRVNREITKILTDFSSVPLLIAAAIEGDCIGGGCELALACDWICASESARFSFKQSSLGLTPGWGGAKRLLRRVSPPVALDWLTSGRWISASEALREGLCDMVFSSRSVAAKAKAFLEDRPTLEPKLLGALKKVIYSGGQKEQAVFESLWFGKDHRQAMKRVFDNVLKNS